ncbi:putative phosphoesterase domain protein [Synechococcus sp. MVIR-18-1]|nr:putative phosphoesterase domain protein [Synechococcus sp. MVIR-18-1]
MGHTHHPFIRSNNGTTFVNVGSCGLPRDDGRYGAACLYNPISQDLKIIRFPIYEQTKTLLTAYPTVNKSVYNLLERRSHSIFGDLL